MNSEMTTFWQFLSETPIRIPIIQRDYAQGREGKEELRKTFLNDLKQALDAQPGKRLKLDFVYGATEEGALNPLDGQQRLTTLWLLHWFVAFMAGEIGSARDTLKKFSYETRQSSRDFCERLSEFAEQSPDGTGIVDHIQNQTWFRSSWRNDPTVQAMLRMLGGSAKDSPDGIEGVFRNICAKVYWSRLTGNECPVVFLYLDIHGIGQTDDLYIKMNARGKPLTSFENFKADLAGYIAQQARKDGADGEWHSFDDPQTGIAIKMDTDWMDGIFWKNKSSDSAVDEIYFAFLNRFFFGGICLGCKDDKNESYKYLYDEKASYSSLSPYNFGGDKEFEKGLNSLHKVMEVFREYAKDCKSPNESIPKCSWDDNFRFIPEYAKVNGAEWTKDNAGNDVRNVTQLTQPQRVVFFSICKFFSEVEAGVSRDSITARLERWMRVVWNLVSVEDKAGKSQIRDFDSMRTAMKFVNNLNSQDVYASLSKFQVIKGKDPSAFDVQCEEEKEKASKIIGDPSWETKIIQAEKTAFFTGAIRFLYMNGNGEVDWNDFDVKLKNAKKFFDKDGVSNEYRQNALLLRAFLASERLKAESGFWFGHGKVFWRNTVLLDASFTKAADELLKSEALPVSDKAAEWITDADLIADAINGDTGSPDGNWHILSNWKYGGDKTLTRYTNRVAGNVNFPNQIIPLSGFADDSLQRKRQDCLTGEMIASSPQRRGTKWLIGWTSDVEFRYRGHWLRWLGAPNRDRGEYDICLLKDNWQNEGDPYMDHAEDTTKDGHQRTCCRFNVDATENSETFIGKLNNLMAALV